MVSDLPACRLPIRLKGPIDVVPKSPVILPCPRYEYRRPLCRLHKQHKAMISNGNILKLRLPLVRVPGMFLQDGFYLLDSRRVLLMKDLVSDSSREHMAGMFQAEAGGQHGKREKYEGGD